MEHIRNPKNSSHSLPNKYEKHLSPFGRKVMAVLYKLKQEASSKSCKLFSPQPPPRYRNKRVIQFKDDSDAKCQFSYKNALEANTRDVFDNNIHTIENATLISTSSDLLKSPKDYYNLKDANIKLNFNGNNSSSDFQIINSSNASISKQTNENLVNLGFNQILDINDIFDCDDDNNIDKSAENPLGTKELHVNKVVPDNEIKNDYKLNLTCNTKQIIHRKEPIKRRNIRSAQSVKEKKSKISDTIHEKNSHRKENYTATVKKWLNDVHLKNKKEGGQSNEELPISVIRANQRKVLEHKKEIQTQLANKDGVMKYTKPKDIETKNAFENNNKELKAKRVFKEKQVRAKFIAPIKSQIPVKDIEYPINVINDNYFKEFVNQFEAVKNEEIFIMLIFSFSRNAFCQFISTNTVICYDAKKILLYLYNDPEEEIKMSVIFDTKIGGSLISPDEPPKSFSDVQKILSITPDYTVATECVLQRAAWYTTLLKESASKLRAMMIENGVYRLFVNIEMKILPIIADMERRGVCVDVTKLNFMEGVLMSRIKEVESECHESAGKPFQINSTLQVRTIIYDELKLDTKCNVKILETVSKGAKSTSETMLRSLSGVHPLPRLILEYRHLHKACATFVKGVARHVVHGVIRPKCAPMWLKFRSVYTSGAGRCLLAADFKQLECRLFAHAARDLALQHALGSRDLFTVLAAQWLCKSEGSVSSEERSLTKRVVYASLYGAGPRTIGHVMQGTGQQLVGIIDSFNRHPTETFPSLKSFGKSVVSECESRGGRLTTPSGRTRTFKNIFSTDFAVRSQAERRAVNFIIQGTAADVCKLAMVATYERLRGRGRLLLQLHDELVWEVDRRHLHSTAAMIKSAMESCGRELGLALDLPVAMYCGDNWGEMEEFTPCEDDSV